MTAPTPWSYDLEFIASPPSVGSARNFVGDLLRHHGLPHLVDDVRLVVSELATNAVMHARTGFSVTLRGFEGFVVVEVHDGCRAGPFLRASPSLDTNGRGISIVQALSRDWGVNEYEGGSKAVWAEFLA